MKSLSLATNQNDRLEAVFVGEDGNVKHIWQCNSGPGNKYTWNAVGDLIGPSGTPLTNAVAVSALSNEKGEIQAIAYDTNGDYYRIDQSANAGAWSDLVKIEFGCP